ncbi:3-hydroxyisobutyrate dehydrogenase [Amycolatopsis sp. PS_44_ISF1]|uniref:3-hydroxyisobutyrate dehydrogenase n=1 Tax=Amycolatopsis sp. PS_44_ISF1 TaxID=2974917 RepID=UPI0028DD56FE|nr:3-hydroxyisobutyrate dehydrogenase [Amycolatopsis sp. PS_44_ISF1]MDT8913209.1 3-hydroxyisobutyrate dehydrogenase [Amycolatopsis sp. PS_44_ISF1]MDT8916258.1 3-hydroxyisobutyrate dehydrogenase [Amycolatopsis sp. PS_44_ISF1]
MSTAFLGLGNMGGPMAANLVKAGEEVTGYDPSPEARAAASAAGVSVVDNAVAAVAGAGVVITMLPSGGHVLELYRELVPAAGPGTLFLDCSTIEVADARAAAGLATGHGHLALDAPVSGGVVGAGAATLTFMAGGPAEAFAAAEPHLKHMGAKLVHCGETGAGQAAKICNNLILGVSMIAVSEAFALGRGLGLTDQALFDVASTASGQCWALTTNCPVPGPVPASPANRDYRGGFASGLMLKDLRLAQAAAQAEGVRTALGDHAERLYTEFVEQDGPGRDFSAIITGITG